VGDGLPVATTEKVAVAGACTDVLAGCVVMTGAVSGGLTVSVAALDVAEPCELVAVTSYLVPDCDAVVGGVVYEADVAPEIGLKVMAPGASLDHCKVGAGLPDAAAVNVAVAGAVTVWLAGCVVMVGAASGGLTVRVAADDVTEPTGLDTVTSYLVPLCAAVVAGVVNEVAVAPAIDVNDEAPGASLDHW